MFYLLPVVLGTVSLAHGQGWIPKTYLNIIWGLILGGLTWFLLSGQPIAGWLLVTLSVTAGLLCLSGKATGHGRGLGLHNPVKGTPEKLEIFIKWSWKYIGDYWYKVLILSTSGLLAVSGTAITVGLYNPIAGSVIALSGLLKGQGYMFGQWLEDRWILDRFYKMFRVRVYSNQIGEFLAGFFAGLGLLFANILT